MVNQNSFHVYSLEPVLEVNNLEATLDYYTSVLGFSVDWTWPNEGDVTHASVSFGEGHSHEEHGEGHIHLQLAQSDTTPVANSGWLYLRVNKNIGQLYTTLKAKGAELLDELENKPWGMREFNIKENNGHQFRFGYEITEE